MRAMQYTQPAIVLDDPDVVPEPRPATESPEARASPHCVETLARPDRVGSGPSRRVA